MSDFWYLLDKIFLWEEIPAILLDSASSVIDSRDSGLDIRGFYGENRDLLALLVDRVKQSEQPVLYLENEVIAYGGMADPNTGEVCLLGPVILEELSYGQIRGYRNITRLLAGDWNRIRSSLEAFMGCFHVLYYALYGRQLKQKEFLENNSIQKERYHTQNYEMILYQVRNSEQDRARVTYQEEQKWLQQVKEGRFSERNSLEKQQRVGTLAKSSKRQTEYMCVCTITLLTRASIEGGLQPLEAYDLSDLYLQKLEKCKNEMEMQQILINAHMDFLRRIQEEKRRSREPDYIRKCKDYIALHRTKELHVGEIARAVGMNHSYLSKKFKEAEGITLREYIIREKVDAAANMMKYSEISLNDIAQYLNFASQSHMGAHFKKEYGMTPNEYRKKYKIIE